MVAIEEEGHKVAKSKGQNRRCYAVKVCIEKNPPKNTRRICKDPCARTQVREHDIPCPPPLPPRIQTPNCRPCEYENTKPPPTRQCCKKDTDTQCSLGPPKQMQDCPCQTILTEQKHCGHQTTHEVKNTRHCQTELEDACGVVGVSHDKKLCSKSCCRKDNNKRDACCQHQTPPPPLACGTQTNCNNSRPKCRKKGGNRPNCQQRHTFPFVGRTPSGNLKVSPTMVSYENKEFGILVANPSCMKTSVKKITSCDVFQEGCPCLPEVLPPPPPLPRLPQRPPPSLPKGFSCRKISSPCSSTKDSCQTAQDRPLPRYRPESQNYPQPYEGPQYRHSRFDRNDPELPQATNYPNSLYDATPMKPVAKPVYESHNQLGHTDGWNYVNPKYRENQTGYPKPHPRIRYAPEEWRNNNEVPKYPDSIISEKKPAHYWKSPLKQETVSAPTQQNDQHFEGYLDTGFLDGQHENEQETVSNHVYSGRKDPDLGSSPRVFPEEPSNVYFGHPAPYIPAFPPENVNQKEFQYPMSDADGYHTPTEVNEVEDRNSKHAAAGVRSNRIPRHVQQDTPPTVMSNMERESNLVGKLHYLVKGTVASDAKIKVGEAVFPVQSVVLEIRSKLFDTEDLHASKVMDTVVLPDFNSLRIRRPDSDQETIRGEEMITVEDEANMTDDREFPKSRGELYRAPTEHEYQNFDNKSPSTSDPIPHFSQYVPFTSPTDVVIDPQSDNRLPSTLPPGYRDRYPEDDVVDQYDHLDETANVIPCQSCKSNYNFSAPPTSPFDEHLLQETTSSLNEWDIPPSLLTDAPLIPHPSSVSRNPTTATSTGGGMLAESTLDFVIPTAEPPVPMPRRTSKEVQQAAEDVSGILPNLDVIQGAILAFGGVNTKLSYSNENSGRDVFLYTRDADEWTKLGELPVPRTHFGLARVENDVYLIGGLDPEHRDHYGKGMAVQTNLRLNLRSGKWDLVAGLDAGRSHFGCIAIDKHIFVIGGNIESRATSSCLVFNTENQTWNPIASLDSTRSNMGIALYGNGILVAGGTNKDAKKPVLDTVMHYDPHLNRWTPWKSLPSPRAFCSLATTNNHSLYLVAGAGLKNVGRRKNSSLDEILQFDENTKAWVHGGVLRHARHGQTTTVLDNGIVVIGGISSHTVGPLNSVEIWSPTTGNSVKVKNFPHHRSGMSALTL